MSAQDAKRKTTRMLKPARGVNILSKFSRMADQMEPRSLVEMLVQTIVREFGVSWVQVFLQNEKTMRLAASRGTRKSVGEIKLNSSARNFLLKRHEPVGLHGLGNEEKLGGLLASLGKHQPSLIFPMVHRDTLVGLCVLGRPLERGPLSSAERELLTAMANHAGLAVGATNTVKKVREATRKLRKVKREKEAYDAHKDDFVRITCHEINTPLTEINLTACMLLDGEGGKLSAEQKKLVEQILNNTARLVEVNNDLVHLARRGIEREHYLEWCSFEEIFTHVLEKASPLFAKRSDLDVRISVNEGIPPLFVCPHDIVRALVNVIQNSIKFTPEKDGRIDVTAEYRGGNMLCIVKDNGVGVGKQYHDLVFEPFIELIDQRKRSSSKTRFLGAGLGLGLTISKEIIEKHGGAMRLESEGENRGTTVYISLPVAEGKA
ncbi:MAG: GAF domain-containing sensor histidine kinase [Planctomycetota bacterium]